LVLRAYLAVNMDLLIKLLRHFTYASDDLGESSSTRMSKEDIEFIVDDILDSKLKEDSFDYIFDYGCFSYSMEK
jgi:hypothetical protein